MVIRLLIYNSSWVLCLGDFNTHFDQENDLRAKRHSTACPVRTVSFRMCVFQLMRKVIQSTCSWLMLEFLHPKGEPGPTLQGYVQSDHHPSTILDITCPKPHKPSKIIKFCVNSLIWIWNTSKENSLLVWLTAQSQVMWILWWKCIMKL